MLALFMMPQITSATHVSLVHDFAQHLPNIPALLTMLQPQTARQKMEAVMSVFPQLSNVDF